MGCSSSRLNSAIEERNAFNGTDSRCFDRHRRGAAIYIGENSQRSIDVQEAVEACCKNIGGKLLFIGTGQTAVTGTSNLKKLEGRFTVRIELSDADVDAVIRQVILAKKAESLPKIEQTLQQNLGEISRHLAESNIGHRQKDIPVLCSRLPHPASAPPLLGKHPARARPDRYRQPACVTSSV